MKKTILSILLAGSLLTSGAASALEAVNCTYDQAGKTHITGTAEPGESVTVRIFKKNNHLDDDGNFSYTRAKTDLNNAVEAAKIQSVLCFADETVAGDNGKFDFDAKISKLLTAEGLLSTDPVSDIYVVVTKTAGDEEITEYLFVDPTERATVYSDLSQMKDSSEADVVAYLEANKYALGIYVPSLDSIDTDSAYALMYDYLVSKDFGVADGQAASLDMLKLLVIEALNLGKVETIASYESELRIPESEIASWYTKPVVNDTFMSALTTRLSAKSFDDIAEFDDAFTEAVVLQWIESSDGIDDCMAIIGDFKEDIGYSANATIDEAAVRAAMGGDYAAYSELKSAIDGYKGDDDDDDDDDKQSNVRNPGKGGNKNYGSGITVPSAPVTQPQAINTYFSDLADASWAIEAINYLAEKKVLAGKSQGVFAPNDNVTRAEFAKILVTAFGLTQKADIAFTDVSADSWYYDAVSIAVGSGIAKGMSDDRFGPEENITRQDMSVMLMNAARIAKAMAEADGNLNFPDEAEISDYAKAAVSTLSKAGIINGMGDGSFAPKAFATRAQAAKLVHALLTY